jgi:hypothetical protein
MHETGRRPQKAVKKGSYLGHIWGHIWGFVI